QTKGKVLRVPTLALIGENEVLIRDGERAKKVDIKTGMRNWEWTEVKSGLTEGQLIIVSLDREEVRDGALIREKTEEDKKK
ncbi:MAG: efflux RND transporter periplasmic adaptor subunit, partial [Planctomycetota bacterium]